MSAFANKLRKVTVTAQEREAAKRALDELKKARDHLDNMAHHRERGATEDYLRVKQTLVAAANNGSNSSSYLVCQGESLDDYDYARANALIARLEKDGLKAKTRRSYLDDRGGSDPYYGCEMYFLYVEINW